MIEQSNDYLNKHVNKDNIFERDLFTMRKKIMRRMQSLCYVEKQNAGAVEHMMFDFDGEENNFSVWVNQFNGVQSEYGDGKEMEGQGTAMVFFEIRHLTMNTEKLIQ